MTKLNKDILLGLGLAVVFGIILFAVIPRAIVVPSNINILSLRPDFWPGVLCVSLMALSLAMAGVSLFAQIRSKTHPGSPEKNVSIDNKPGHLKAAKPYIVIIGLLVYYFLVEPLGIILSSILALLGLALLYGERNYKILFPLALLLPVGLYLFFTKIANIPLPVGSIFN